MKKKKLLKILEPYNDDIEIYLSDWSEEYESPLKDFSVSLKEKTCNSCDGKVVNYKHLELG